MALNDVDSFLLEGTQNPPSPNPGFIRLTTKGPVSQFVEFRSADNADPALGPFPPNSHATYLVKNTSELHFSDYELPPPPPPPPVITGPIKIKPQPPTPPGQYLSSEGSLLNPIATNGQITGFRGTTKAGDNYVLSAETSASRGTGKNIGYTPWVGARIGITSNGNNNDILWFGFTYSPLYDYFSVFLDHCNVSNGISVDLSGLVGNGVGGSTGSASVARSMLYYGNSYSLQTLQVPADQNNPQIVLPARLTMWPFLDRAAFFAPALKSIATEKAASLVSAHPLSALGSLPVVWPATVDVYVKQTLAVVGPALGNFAASFVPPPDSGIAGMADASLWLGWILMSGPGNANLVAAITGQYDYWKSQVPPTGHRLGGFPVWKSPSPRLSIGEQVQDWLFK